MALIDLSQEPHPAPHPRYGAVDMVSFMPLSEQMNQPRRRACANVTTALGTGLFLADLGCPILLMARVPAARCSRHANQPPFQLRQG